MSQPRSTVSCGLTWSHMLLRGPIHFHAVLLVLQWFYNYSSCHNCMPCHGSICSHNSCCPIVVLTPSHSHTLCCNHTYYHNSAGSNVLKRFNVVLHCLDVVLSLYACVKIACIVLIQFSPMILPGTARSRRRPTATHRHHFTWSIGLIWSYVVPTRSHIYTPCYNPTYCYDSIPSIWPMWYYVVLTWSSCFFFMPHVLPLFSSVQWFCVVLMRSNVCIDAVPPSHIVL